ncbi:hypothetical protein SS50377_28117 [Spironucleus salmonicida]|uniref:Uncharacterized protein n=1 Tax=Spironucleus salmonicida TaxID=348837 RepID=V6LGI9_9EUKA|nr:hypothetical protein SS50377_28117 [Spironucleus salmonicida]|eukprot:EST42801.1 Hypothetical protein SS50377_17570 [Spironucleus salmonicida]
MYEVDMYFKTQNFSPLRETTSLQLVMTAYEDDFILFQAPTQIFNVARDDIKLKFNYPALYISEKTRLELKVQDMIDGSCNYVLRQTIYKQDSVSLQGDGIMSSSLQTFKYRLNSTYISIHYQYLQIQYLEVKMQELNLPITQNLFRNLAIEVQTDNFLQLCTLKYDEKLKIFKSMRSLFLPYEEDFLAKIVLLFKFNDEVEKLTIFNINIRPSLLNNGQCLQFRFETPFFPAPFLKTIDLMTFLIVCELPNMLKNPETVDFAVQSLYQLRGMFTSGLLNALLSASSLFYDVNRPEFQGIPTGLICENAKKQEGKRFKAQSKLFESFSYIQHDEEYVELSCKGKLKIIVASTEKLELRRRFYPSLVEYMKIFREASMLCLVIKELVGYDEHLFIFGDQNVEIQQNFHVYKIDSRINSVEMLIEECTSQKIVYYRYSEIFDVMETAPIILHKSLEKLKNIHNILLQITQYVSIIENDQAIAQIPLVLSNYAELLQQSLSSAEDFDLVIDFPIQNDEKQIIFTINARDDVFYALGSKEKHIKHLHDREQELKNVELMLKEKTFQFKNKTKMLTNAFADVSVIEKREIPEPEIAKFQSCKDFIQANFMGQEEPEMKKRDTISNQKSRVMTIVKTSSPRKGVFIPGKLFYKPKDVYNTQILPKIGSQRTGQRSSSTVGIAERLSARGYTIK